MSRLAAPTCLAALLSLAAASTAFAGWGPDGVTVWPSTSVISVVAAANDGGLGTFVAWHEGSIYTTPGPLRVQHLLPNGFLDPAWPADGTLASSVAAHRTFVTAVPDRQGGVYVCWTEGTNPASLFLTRIDPDGQVGTGWPASGMSLGAFALAIGRPSVIEDGAHGVYVAWNNATHIRALRVGVDGLGVGGWPDQPRTVVPDDDAETVHFWPDLALAPDGGIFLSWATWSFDTTAVQSGLRVRRLTGSGENSPGWPVEGLMVGSFRPEGIPDIVIQAPLLDIAPDGRGGLFVYAGSLWSTSVSSAGVSRRLHRLRGDGEPASDWPEGGRELPDYFYYDWRAGPDLGLRVQPDGIDGAFVEGLAYVLHAPPSVSLARCTAAGEWPQEWPAPWAAFEVLGAGHETVVTGDGRAFVAQFEAYLEFGYRDWPPAFIGVDQWAAPMGWAHWREWHNVERTGYQVFGDIALAPSGDGGVVLFWSQVRYRFGLFARRFSPSGEVTVAVRQPGWEITPLFQLSFSKGVGVRARVALDRTPERLDLFDINGRRVASLPLGEGAGTDEITLPGTASLASGLYFARLMAGGVAAVGKVAVVH